MQRPGTSWCIFTRRWFTGGADDGDRSHTMPKMSGRRCWWWPKTWQGFNENDRRILLNRLAQSDHAGKIRDWWCANKSQPLATGGSSAHVGPAVAARRGGDLVGQASDDDKLLYLRMVGIRGEFEESTWSSFYEVVAIGQSPADVAADKGISVNSVYLARSRFLRRLRKEFDDAP